MYTLSNTGAYGEHGPTTVGLSGHKSIPLYTNNLEAFRFAYDVVYTNRQSAGAYRGYGATQGIFAVESAVNELADILGMDPVAIREKNMVREGQVMPAYYNEKTNACALDRCMNRCAQLFGWEEKFPVRDMGNGKVRAAGVAMAISCANHYNRSACKARRSGSAEESPRCCSASGDAYVPGGAYSGQPRAR